MCTPVSVTISSSIASISAIVPQVVATILLAVGAIITLLARPVSRVKARK